MTHQRCLAHIAQIEGLLGESRAEAQYYLEQLNELWHICAPNKRGHYKRDLGTLVLSHVAYACSFRERNYICVESDNRGTDDQT